jgi:Mrp family chromosome partitioning ATPase
MEEREPGRTPGEDASPPDHSRESLGADVADPVGLFLAEPVAPASAGTWLGRRARNAARRIALISVAGGLVFVAMLVTLIVIPHRARRAAAAIMPRAGERPDTARLRAADAIAANQLARAEAALARARARAARRALPPPPDTLPTEVRIRRDSLQASIARLTTLLERAEAAPLFTSYRALGVSPELQADLRVGILLDSLSEIERQRDAFGATGGVDPLFVALTSRAGELGRALQEIGAARRAAMREEMERLRPPPRPVVTLPPVDTTRVARARDSARDALVRTRAALGSARDRNRQLDARQERAREISAIAASPPAMLAASLIFGLAAGFAIALIAELRRPRVSDAREIERLVSLPVIARVGPAERMPERSRRQADREVPPLIDQTTDTYRQLYLSLADGASNLRGVAITGDEPAVVAAVAVNLAAAASHQARHALVIDGDVTVHSVSAALHLPPAPGATESLTGEVEWPEVIVHAVVGRDRTIDVIPAGRRLGAKEALSRSLRDAVARLARRFDTVVLSAPWLREVPLDRIVSAVPGIVIVARTGRTTAGGLKRLVAAIAEAGGSVRGIVAWEAPDPAIPFLSEVPERTSLLPRYAAMRRTDSETDSDSNEQRKAPVTGQE